MNHGHHEHHNNENIFMGGEALPPEFADYEHLFRPQQQVYHPSITSSSGRRGFSSKKLIIALAIIFGAGALAFLAMLVPTIFLAIIYIVFGY